MLNARYINFSFQKPFILIVVKQFGQKKSFLVKINLHVNTGGIPQRLYSDYTVIQRKREQRCNSDSANNP